MFQLKLQQHGIADRPITVKNPQANAVCERMHQTVANMLCTLVKYTKPKDKETAVQLVENALATAAYATRVSVACMLGALPGSLVYGRDMLVDVPVLADLITIQERRQQKVNENLMRENAKRREYYFEVGQEVLVKADNPNKLEPRAHGPYVVRQVYTNGTIDIARKAQVTERINI